MAVSVHKNIQQRDLEVGRNLGNWILRWLDRMKPTAEIRPKEPSTYSSMSKNITSSRLPHGASKTNVKPPEKESSGRLLFSPLNIRPKCFRTVSMMMQARNLASFNSQYKNVTVATTYPPRFDERRGSFGGVLREDIAQWMLH